METVVIVFQNIDNVAFFTDMAIKKMRYLVARQRGASSWNVKLTDTFPRAKQDQTLIFEKCCSILAN